MAPLKSPPVLPTGIDKVKERGEWHLGQEAFLILFFDLLRLHLVLKNISKEVYISNLGFPIPGNVKKQSLFDQKFYGT